VTTLSGGKFLTIITNIKEAIRLDKPEDTQQIIDDKAELLGYGSIIGTLVMGYIVLS
jgi:hypothetical protein